MLSQIPKLAAKLYKKPVEKLPKVTVIESSLDSTVLKELYHSSDIFVLPTRGEGWCLPCVEAMATGKPIIATNFSGPTAYLDNSVGYPLSYNKVSKDGTVEPNKTQLTELLTYTATHREEVVNKGKTAQARVIERYSPTTVAKIAVNRILHRLSKL